ncbi:MAG TPA: DUF1508 domain-containing protein [Phycisphaerae bacterium]|nr:DUF1508 domain-containing protein [Phycisphaerae bacterium]
MSKRKAKIEVVPWNRGDEWYWRLKGANGEIVCTSKNSPRKSTAISRAKRAQALMAEAEIVVVE